MITGVFRLDEYGGICVKVYFAVNSYYADDIIADLRAINFRGSSMRKAKRNLRRGKMDEGLTVFSPEYLAAVVVTQLTSSAAEFYDSLCHEMRHLSDYICGYFGFKMGTEEAGYLSGAIAKAMWPWAKGLLCEHCRKRNGHDKRNERDRSV